MSLHIALLALVTTAVLAACGKDDARCEKFVDLALQCDDELRSAPASERSTARVLMDSMCEEAFKNDTSGVPKESRQLVAEVYSEMRERADCAAKATTCSQYETCAPD